MLSPELRPIEEGESEGKDDSTAPPAKHPGTAEADHCQTKNIDDKPKNDAS